MEEIKPKRTVTKTNSNYVIAVKNERAGRRLSSFSVTHDSVVATMNFTTTNEIKQVKIFWGDETQNQQPETINVSIFFVNQPLGGEALPKDTFKIQHVYDDNAPKRKIILVQVQDKKNRFSWENAVIDIEPRYTFISYPVILNIKDHLDTFLESDSELKINMLATLNDATILEKNWNPVITTDSSLPVSFKLNDSSIKLEMVWSDKPIYFNFLLSEEDNIFKEIGRSIANFITNPGVEFDGSIQLNFLYFHPKFFKGSKQFVIDYRLDKDGNVDVIFNVEMNLIVPLDKPKLPVSVLV